MLKITHLSEDGSLECLRTNMFARSEWWDLDLDHATCTILLKPRRRRPLQVQHIPFEGD